MMAAMALLTVTTTLAGKFNNFKVSTYIRAQDVARMEALFVGGGEAVIPGVSPQFPAFQEVVCCQIHQQRAHRHHLLPPLKNHKCSHQHQANGQ